MSVLKLYKNSKIVESEHFILNEYYGDTSLTTYLASLTSPLIFNKCQINQNKLDLEYKIQLDQFTADYLTANNYNYAVYYPKTTNLGAPYGNPIFYFIKKIEVLAPNTAKLYLHMETRKHLHMCIKTKKQL